MEEGLNGVELLAATASLQLDLFPDAPLTDRVSLAVFVLMGGQILDVENRPTYGAIAERVGASISEVEAALAALKDREAMA